MKAAVLREQNKPMEIEEVQISKPGPREVMVRPIAMGVCHSDLHFLNGSYPYMLPTILGHESAGIVEEVGADDVKALGVDLIMSMIERNIMHRRAAAAHNGCAG